MSGGRTAAEAMAAVVAGVATLIVVRFGVAGAYPWVDPALSGIIASAVAFSAYDFRRSAPRHIS